MDNVWCAAQQLMNVAGANRLVREWMTTQQKMIMLKHKSVLNIMTMKRTTIRYAALVTTVTAILSVMQSVQAQNLVTFIPPDKSKLPPPEQMDTIITVIDAATNYRRMTILDHNIVVRDGYMVGDKKTGRWTEYTDTGVMLQLVDYENDVKSGDYMEFDVNGSLEVLEHYKNGLLDGEQKRFVQGQKGRILKSAYAYKEGKLHGTCSEYTSDGKLQSQSTYVMGKKTGPASWYFSNGKLALTQIYEQDQLNGTQSVYNQEGTLISQGTYKNNMREGTWTEYYDSGKMKTSGNYTQDKKTGTWTYYDESGAVSKTEKL